MEKNRVLNQSLTHSITHSPSLFDALGTEALALRNNEHAISFFRIVHAYCSNSVYNNSK